jgi:DNA-binding NtrC family response regulator
MQVLMAYSWPGNVRELENALTRGVVLTPGEVLTVDTLPIEMDEDEPVSAVSESSEELRVSESPEVGEELLTLREVERRHILKVLSHTGWNKRRSCSVLQITRPTLDRKIKEYSLERPTAGAHGAS